MKPHILSYNRQIVIGHLHQFRVPMISHHMANTEIKLTSCGLFSLRAVQFSLFPPALAFHTPTQSPAETGLETHLI